MPLDITTLFKDIPTDMRHFFTSTIYPWDVIKNIARLTIEHKKGCDLFAHGYVIAGIPLSKPMVILPGGDVLDTGFELRLSAKGASAIMDGKIVNDASILMAGAVFWGEEIKIGKGVLVETGACVQGPTVLGDGTQVRHGAYIRGGCFAGERCVIGHATEVKNAIFMDGAKAGHFAYVGDSILGREVNLGAGTKLANLKFKGNVTVKVETETIDTGLRKFGAILGDFVQTGCNSVCNPGTVVGCDSLILANASVKPGYYPPRSMIRG